MRIVLEHRAVIPPARYGGTERVVTWLARGLVEAGHEVALISEPSPHPLPGVQAIAWTPDWPEKNRELLKRADALHLWAPPGHPRYECPVLVTIGGNGKPGEAFHPNTVFVSQDHARRHGARFHVYNGLDPADWEADASRGEHLVFLAKASWKVKNLAGAIQVARAARLPLEVLGSRSLPLELQRLLPRWRGVRYHGMVDDAYKRRILRGARALLFPVRWDEPFGIAMTEALASGCPVLGTPYGSLPEVVTPQVGFLSADGKALVRILGEPLPAPAVCRERVLRDLTYRHMTEAYLGLYARIGRETLHPADQPPRASANAATSDLKPWKSV